MLAVFAVIFMTVFLSLGGVFATFINEVMFVDSEQLRTTPRASPMAEPTSSLLSVLSNIALIPWVPWAFGTLFTFVYASISEYKFVNQPWRRVWPIIPLVLFGPVYWISVAVSALLYFMIGDRNERVELDPQPPMLATAIDRGRREMTVDQIRPGRAKPSAVSYPTGPQTAQQAYVAIRTDASNVFRKTQLTSAERELDTAQKRATELGEQLREIQATINDKTAQLKQLNAALAEPNSDANSADAIAEFTRIAKLPGVVAVQSVNGRLRLIVRASYKFMGSYYDLGDWQLDVHPGAMHLTALMRRDGCKPSWRGGYPAYRLEYGVFCFGNQQSVIDQHMRKGQYIEALSIAVTTLNNVNFEDRPKLPFAFETTRRPRS